MDHQELTQLIAQFHEELAVADLTKLSQKELNDLEEFLTEIRMILWRLRPI